MQMDKSQNAVEIFDKRALDYQNKFMDVGLYHDSFDLFCNTIEKENAAILEIACGPGNISRYLLAMRPGFQLLGIDLSANMIALAKTNNPTAEFVILDAREITKLNKQKMKNLFKNTLLLLATFCFCVAVNG